MATQIEAGLPLKSFNSKTPPGWKPDDPKYPFKQYCQLIRLWLAQTELKGGQHAAAMIGRLHGMPFQMAIAGDQDKFEQPDENAHLITKSGIKYKWLGVAELMKLLEDLLHETIDLTGGLAV